MRRILQIYNKSANRSEPDATVFIHLDESRLLMLEGQVTPDEIIERAIQQAFVHFSRVWEFAERISRPTGWRSHYFTGLPGFLMAAPAPRAWSPGPEHASELLVLTQDDHTLSTPTGPVLLDDHLDHLVEIGTRGGFDSAANHSRLAVVLHHAIAAFGRLVSDNGVIPSGATRRLLTLMTAALGTTEISDIPLFLQTLPGATDDLDRLLQHGGFLRRRRASDGGGFVAGPLWSRALNAREVKARVAAAAPLGPVAAGLSPEAAGVLLHDCWAKRLENANGEAAIYTLLSMFPATEPTGHERLAAEDAKPHVVRFGEIAGRDLIDGEIKERWGSLFDLS